MMRQTLTTFIGGVIVGGATVAVSGYVAGFERPLRQAVSTVAAIQPSIECRTGWEDLVAVEKRVPKELQACVNARYAAETRRHQETWQRNQTFALERAVSECVAMQKPPKTVAQK